MEARRRQALLREQRERELAIERQRALEEEERRAEALEAQRREREEARLRQALEQDAERHRDRWEDGGPLDPREPEPENDNATSETRADEIGTADIVDEATFASPLTAAFDESTEIARVRARLERSAQRETEAQRRAVLTDMLEVLDDLDRALAAGDDASAFTQGVALVRDNFLRKLERHGVTRGDDARGMPFDPERHTAIGTAPAAPDQDGTVVEVLGPAYFVGDDLLRAAQVIVGRG